MVVDPSSALYTNRRSNVLSEDTVVGAETQNMDCPPKR